jgi:hypothetical protein
MPVKIFGEKTIAVFRAIERNQTYTIQVNHLMDGLTLDVIGKAGFGNNNRKKTR